MNHDDDPVDTGLTPAQEAELERRLATLDEDIKSGSTWEQIEAEIDHRPHVRRRLDNA